MLLIQVCNLSVIVNCVTNSLNRSQCLCLCLCSHCSRCSYCMYCIFRKEIKKILPGGLPLPMCPIYKVSKLKTESFAPHIAAGKTYFAHIYPNPLVWKHKENDHQILFMVTKCRDKYFCIH